MLQREAGDIGGSFRGCVCKRLFGLSRDEAKFARRGFSAGEPQAQRHLERIGEIFLMGYNAALEGAGCEALARHLNQIEEEFRGFAFEGAAMGLSLLDRVTPWGKNRWRHFARGPGAAHVYMMHVGLGWTFARLRQRIDPHLSSLDPLLCWLTVDGYGFHEGYFRWRRYVEERAAPLHLGGYARRAFDQGLGRSIWFVRGANVGAVGRAVAAFEPARRGDLWSGIGLACAYAGGVDAAGMEALREAAGIFRAQAAQGVAFAAKTRQRAGNPSPHTESACMIFCGRPADGAAGVTDDCLRGLPGNGRTPDYEVWRQRIQHAFREEVVRA